MGIVLAVLIAVLGMMLGAVAAFSDGWIALILFAPVLPLLFVLRDYRVGVVCLTFVLPWSGSPLLPQARGFNVVTYLTILTLMVFLGRAMFRATKPASLPSVFVWCYLLPISVGAVLALPHLGEGARNFALFDAGFSFEPYDFLKAKYLKPLAYVIYAFLLGNALRDSKRPERFLAALAFAAVLPAVAVLVIIGLHGFALSELQSQRAFLGPLGLHANEMALSLALATGPLLYMWGAVRNGLLKLLCLAAMSLVIVALILTFSRAGFVGLVVIAVTYLFFRKRKGTIVAFVLLCAVLLVAAPQAVRDRLTTGVESGALSNTVSNRNDEKLTQGRVVSWMLLAPDVLRSPLWGRGVASTAWTSAVTKGVYAANHPHNMYLEILLDLGVLGFLAIVHLGRVVLRSFRRLAMAEELSPLMRRYFAGAAASFLGMLAMGFTSGHYMPYPEQAFMWFSLGTLFAYWPLAQQLVQTQDGQQIKKGFGMRPQVQMPAPQPRHPML
jgi:O-antigen ligase